MKRLMLVSVLLVLCIGGVAAAAQQWYDITFTGADIWTYSADNALQSRTDQAAPRRYATYNNDVTGAPDGTGSRVLQDTTYGVNGLATTGFNAWATSSGFAFDAINLWGAGATGDWAENYTSVGTAGPAPGVSSWNVIQAPTGWTYGIVEGGQSYSADATHAFPVFRSGSGAALSIANMNDPSFVFEVQVLTDSFGGNPARVFFGGFNDDLQMTGPDNYEVSGVMTLTANAIPEPASIIIWSLFCLGTVFGVRVWRRGRKAA